MPSTQDQERSDETQQFAWHDNAAAVYAFATVLHSADWFFTPADVLDYFEKPYKWDPEHRAWNAAGSPTDEDAGWLAFTEQLANLHDAPVSS